MRVVVLQMGKVASWTVVKTIQAMRPEMVLCELSRSVVEKDAIVHLHDPRVFKRHLRDTADDGRDLLVVTLFRDPLRAAIAAFFQNIAEADHPYSHYGPREDVLAAEGSELVAYFREIVSAEHAAAFEDYARRYGAALGLDAYDLPWDGDGVAAGCFARGRFLAIRTHRLAAALPRLAAAVDCPTPEGLIDENRAEGKWYAPAYRRFLDAFTPTVDELTAFYDSRFARSNFSPMDRCNFIEAWASAA